jgi:hypothetical protein
MCQLNSPVTATCSDARVEDNTEQEHAFHGEGRYAVLSFDLAQLPKTVHPSSSTSDRFQRTGRSDDKIKTGHLSWSQV